MFDSEFYPTPEAVIKRMLTPYKDIIRQGALILDPQAGKADILDYITETYFSGFGRSKDKATLYAIELNPDLRFIVQGKGYKVIDTDFLAYSGTYLFDLILMNPPFSNGDEHLLKAWEILEQGHICCLLNKETVDNPYSAKRELLKNIIDKHGSVEYMGQCFNDAERQTGVEVIMVRLEKKAQRDRFDFFSDMDKATGDTFIDEEVLNNQIARVNIFENLVTAFRRAKDVYIDYIKVQQRLHYWRDQLLSDATKEKESAKKTKEEGFKERLPLTQQYNTFVSELTAEAWQYVITKTNIKKLMTSDVRKDFESFTKTQGSLDFTVKNISEFFDLLLLNRNSIMEKCLITVFDELTSYDKKNRVHVEGWKTNDAYKVNRKVICPHFIKFEMDWYSKDWGAKFGVNTAYKWNIIEDIDKAMCYLTGKRFEEIGTLHNCLNRKFDIIGQLKKSQGRKIHDFNFTESEFFNITFFMKGTVHLEFKEEWLWQEFNIRVAKNKNWLPEQK